MANNNSVYTYQAGEKLLLEKRPDQFVVRALPEALAGADFDQPEQVSSASCQISNISAEQLDGMMEKARKVAVAHHAYEMSDSGAEFLITDRVFITFDRDASQEMISALAGKYGLLMKTRFSQHEFLFQLTDATGMNPVKLIVKLTEDEELVTMAEHDVNMLARMTSLPLPTDPNYARQWHLHTNMNHAEFDPRASSHCQAAWQMLDSYGSADVVVGVADDGCLLSHTDFDSASKFAGWGYFRGENLLTNHSVYADPANMHKVDSNHGTSCAGVIAAEMDAQLTVGAAPGCRLLPIKWESSGSKLFISSSKLYTALLHLSDKVDIMSNSWGSSPESMWPAKVTDYIEELTVSGGRRGKGIVFLWAAGNENCPIDFTSDQNIPYSHGWQESAGGWYWADPETAKIFRHSLVGLSGVMQVAALASTAKRSHYSNYGDGISICAPSSNSHAYYRLNVDGLGITTATGAAPSVTDSFGGTSSATPLVAGIAALVISANPSLSALEVISILKKTASRDLDMGGYARTPPASYDPNPDWDVSPVAPFDQGDFQDTGDEDGSWSPWFGHGKVDALAAVRAALALTQSATTGLHVESSPDIAIPDNDANGISDIIRVTRDGVPDEMSVSVDIEHGWIGDLEVRLIAPDGGSVFLHERTGSSADNIIRSYDMGSHPPLIELKNRSIRGDWILRIADRAAADIGRLKRWSIDFQIRGGSISLQDEQSERIPDNRAAGIMHQLEVVQEMSVGSIQVHVDISHPYIGDLRVKLIAPSGTEVVLHDRAGRSSDNINQSWLSGSHSGLASLLGQSARGVWKLQVADLAGRDIGKLNRWSIDISE